MIKILRNKKGQGLVEYGILVGGIALVALAATAILGYKATDLIGTAAVHSPVRAPRTPERLSAANWSTRTWSPMARATLALFSIQPTPAASPPISASTVKSRLSNRKTPVLGVGSWI